MTEEETFLASLGLPMPSLSVTPASEEVRVFNVQRPGEAPQLSIVIRRGPPLRDWICAARPFGKKSPEVLGTGPTAILALFCAFAKLSEKEQQQ